MKKNREISIIIPCYNVEKYIEKCLNSVIKQLKNYKYEIILIDDDSSDNTEKVIKEYIKNNKLNIVFLKNGTNKGAGYSRNRAVKISKYENISFIDSDDIIDDNYYEVLLDELKDNEIVVCDINTVFEDDESKNCLHKGCIGEINKYNILNQGLAASPCNKIIKKHLLLKYPFAEGIINEDIPCILSIILHSKKVGYTNKTKYNYIQREKSVQNTTISDKRLDVIKAIDILNDRIIELDNYDQYMEIIIFHQLIEFFLYVPSKEKNTIKRAKFLKKFYRLTKKYNLNQNKQLSNFYERISRKNKIYYNILFKLNCHGLSLLTSIIISIYNFYKKVSESRIYIKNNLNINDIIKLAKKQNKKEVDISVSVVIPNYNYEHFLLQRLYSILNQTKKVNEIIILDDCSSDNSRELIDEIIDKTKNYINIKKIYNNKNSGCVFMQWQKGFEIAQSDYVWIAEADDYCEKKFLEEHFKLLKKDNSIVLSYVDTAFIDKDGHKVLKTIKREIDILKSGHWDRTYITSGMEELMNYSYLNCTIANVSSVLFKNNNYDAAFKHATQYKQVGDWRFYLEVYKKGNIAYINKTLNYYRVHGNNVTSSTKKQNHFNEIKKIHEELDKDYKLTKIQKKNIKERYIFLQKAWDIEIR